ncbi:gliding motility-associated C-terminal domain-containing protein [Galbibacter sp. EGI 63066]|uniref:T9SS type B sorting domain-containing protein n=1 Tax=Galbibacter sp. EGI 63066 TaxID=2993559 RepID=UPI002248CFE2|nr:gliding motility-associated C-terminal domain-containing protein [Galbibacter sp. EGI 63066]MCX2679083.1 gliding motility-associated C-terminal domain-containing protein [Galbibacter sp. EGI 63066]
MNRTLLKPSIRSCLMLLFFASIALGYGQDLKKPVLGFEDACAAVEYNSFPVKFSWEPTQMVASDNKFIFELSDASGNFSSPTTLATFTDKNTTFDFDVELSMPETVRGDNYKLRVRSTSPAQTSPVSDSFGAYYIRVNDNLIINNFEEASVCETLTSYLEVDNYPGEAAYNWYKDMILIPGENGPSLEVSEPGIYFAELDYGDYCSSSTSSNLVEVSIESAVGMELLGAKQVSLCTDQTYTLTTDHEDTSKTYAWYKDGQLLVKNNSNTLEVNGNDPGFAGEYYVELETGNGCTEQTSTVNIEKESFALTVDTPEGTTVFPQQTISLQANTDAGSAGYQWYKDGAALDGETQSELVVSAIGTYHVEVTQGAGCVFSKTSDAVEITEPSDYMAYISASNYAACENSSVTISLDKIEANPGTSNAYVLPESVLNGFSYQWIYEGNVLADETSQSITVSDASLNGKYKLDVAVEEGKTATSEVVEVKLGLSETPQITGSGNVSCENGNMIVISSSVTSDDYTYTWYRNHVALSESTPSLETNLIGKYQLKIAANGCEKVSNEFVIEPFDTSVVTVDVGETVSIPEGETKIVSAYGGDSYQWFNTEHELMSSSSSVTLSEEGEYTLLASVGECQVTKTIKVTNLTSFVVPNVVTPNGDGFNDMWVIPNSYAYQEDVTVDIYEQSGTPVFSTSGYQNNWPQASSITFSGSNPPIYYYRIMKGKETLKQGTITVIKK